MGNDGVANIITAPLHFNTSLNEEGEDGPRVYTAVHLVPLVPNATPEPIIPESVMPQNIASVVYDKMNKQVYMTGTAVYSFNLMTKTMQKIVDVPTHPNVRYSIGGKSGNILCLSPRPTQNVDETQDIELNLQTKDMTFTDKICDNYYFSSYQPYSTTGLDMLKQLTLPRGYVIVTTP